MIGRGKSALAKSLALRMSAFGVRIYVPGDPKGEWGPVAKAVGVEPIALGRSLPARINPLDPGPRPERISVDEWRRELRTRRQSLLAALAENALDRRLQPVKRSALQVSLTASTPREDAACAPVLPGVVAVLMSPAEDGASSLNMSVRELTIESRNLALELRRLVSGDLAGLFDGPTTQPLDFTAPIQVLDTSRLAGDDTAVALLMTCASAWMESALADPLAGRRLVVYDEAWRMLRHLPLVRRMQAQWKLSRAIGVANLAVLHRISDLGAVGSSGSEAVALAHGLLALGAAEDVVDDRRVAPDLPQSASTRQVDELLSFDVSQAERRRGGLDLVGLLGVDDACRAVSQSSTPSPACAIDGVPDV